MGVAEASGRRARPWGFNPLLPTTGVGRRSRSWQCDIAVTGVEMTTLRLIGRLAVIALAAALAFNATAAKRDFDGDGKADLLWYSDADYLYAIWLMNGTVPVNGAWSTLNEFPGGVRLSTADFNGDRKSDLYLSDGGIQIIRLMDGINPLASAQLPQREAWAIGDFDGDGRADVVWYDSGNGSTTLSLMNGTVEKTAVTLPARHPWLVRLTADFNGDGKSDLLWDNYQTGETAIWLMDGTRYLSGAIVLADGCWYAGSDGFFGWWWWGPAGDLDGDGKHDLVWGNECTGEKAIWLMDGTTMKAGAIVVSDPDWYPKLFGDLNGDGRNDIIWENGVTQATHVWLMNGLTMTAGGPVPLDGAGVIVVDDFDGDGRDDLVTSHGQPAPGFTTYSLWLMDGLNVKSMADLFYSNYWSIWN